MSRATATPFPVNSSMEDEQAACTNTKMETSIKAISTQTSNTVMVSSLSLTVASMKAIGRTIVRTAKEDRRSSESDTRVIMSMASGTDTASQFSRMARDTLAITGEAPDTGKVLYTAPMASSRDVAM